MPIFQRKRDREYQVATKLLADGKTKDAVEMLRKILSENPRYTDAIISLAVGLLQLQKKPSADNPLTKEAISLFDRAIKIKPKDPIPYFNKGVCLRKLGLLENALESFEKAIDIDDKLPLALLHIAEINYELAHWQDALDFARMALVRDPGLEEALSWVPDAMRKAGLLEKS
jgi:tetratricopeptide (TPR) repeat protein